MLAQFQNNDVTQNNFRIIENNNGAGACYVQICYEWTRSVCVCVCVCVCVEHLLFKVCKSVGVKVC